MSTTPEITVRELKAMMDRDEPLVLLDVRRPDEHEYADIGGTLVPLNELPDRLAELEAHRDDLIVVYCRSGARSGRAVQFLQEHGFGNVKNLSGGILAWNREIDPNVPAY